MDFRLPIQLIASEAKKLADNIENRSGVKFHPEIKGQFCKIICGILNGIELQCGLLYHHGAAKNLENLHNNIIPMIIEERRRRKNAKTNPRKKWKTQNPMPKEGV